MRFILAGLITLSITAVGSAQAIGDVESIGFGGGYYRPNVWTPMLVRLRATTGGSGTYKLVVVQEDLDKDHVLFSEKIPLQGNTEGSQAQDQRFWMYFIPQPTKEGIPQGVRGADLNAAIKVFLCTEGGKQLQQLDVTQAVQAIDGNGGRGRKLVLFVAAQSKPILSEFDEIKYGLSEDLLAVTIGEQSLPRSLPENVIGYDAVDAVVWLDADPQLLSEAQDQALRQYIRRGGKLIVSQTGRPVLWEVLRDRWADLLPVTVGGIVQSPKLDALPRISDAGDARLMRLNHQTPTTPPRHFWQDARGPFDLAHAEVKPGAYVAETDGTWPYIVHGSYGRGGVTWVAQDLGESALTGNGEEANKWLYVWDKVFDWPNDPLPVLSTDILPVDHQAVGMYAEGGDVDLGYAEKAGMELESTGAALIALAVLFFIVYWIIAGPGSYLLLASRKRSGMSWFAFAIIALIATASTVLIVRLVLRGPPKLKHVSYVSIAPGVPALVRSEFGLYIPRDGAQKVELKETSPDSPSYVTAYPLHPADVGDTEGYTAYQEYEIPVTDAKTIEMPYRSTLKKFEACWVGQMSGIDGKPELFRETPTQKRRLSGTLVNNTGRTLENIYMAFRYPKASPADDRSGSLLTEDTIYFLGNPWKAGEAINLDNWSGAHMRSDGPQPATGQEVWGVVTKPDTGVWEHFDWNSHWFRFLHDKTVNAWEPVLLTDDEPTRLPMAFPLLSIFDRLPPSAKAGESTRFNILRRGKRQLDASSAVSAGELLILAQAEGGLPIPVEVEGDRINGEGVTYYQFILPLDRSKMEFADPGSGGDFGTKTR